MAMKMALIVIDVQRDFCEGGHLAAADTLSLLQPLWICMEAARSRGVSMVFTQDWHPADHCSFLPNGGPWPVHCVAGTRGAELMPPLSVGKSDMLVRKGTARNDAGYSMFESTGLADQLHALGMESLAVCGIATEYCVRATALDAVREGFRATLLTDLIRAVDSQASTPVLQELAAAGVKLLPSHLWLTQAKAK
jgi:nicotinamidase/pyrazinamidase